MTAPSLLVTKFELVLVNTFFVHKGGKVLVPIIKACVCCRPLSPFLILAQRYFFSPTHSGVLHFDRAMGSALASLVDFRRIVKRLG